MKTERIQIEIPTPHQFQRKMIETTKKRVYCLAGRRGGKTYGLAILSALKFLKDNKKILYAAPTTAQTEAFWDYLVRILKPLEGKTIKINSSDKKIIDIKGNSIKAKTAWDADTLRGDFADMLILDEFELMRENTWEEVGAPMLIDNGGTVYFVFTPPNINTHHLANTRDIMYCIKKFREAENDDRAEIIRWTSYDNPFINAEAIKDLAKDMSSLSYRREIMGEIIDFNPFALWNRTLIERNIVESPPPQDELLQRLLVLTLPLPLMITLMNAGLLLLLMLTTRFMFSLIIVAESLCRSGHRLLSH
jgi:hypothetical protein